MPRPPLPLEGKETNNLARVTLQLPRHALCLVAGCGLVFSSLQRCAQVTLDEVSRSDISVLAALLLESAPS